MRRIRIALWGKWPKGLPLEAAQPVLAWMQEAGVGEVVLVPQGAGYAIRFNADTREVPGVYLPQEALRDPGALLELLREALSIYYEELNLRD